MSARRTAALALLLLAAGCAARYVPSERMRKRAASMDPADAANLFADSFGRTLKGEGLCRAPFGFGAPEPSVTLDGFSLPAWRKGEELGRKQEGGKTLVSYRKVPYVETRRFADIGEIAVLRDAQKGCATKVPLGQQALSLRGGGGPIVIAVAFDALDDLLAALTVLAPRAAIVEAEKP